VNQALSSLHGGSLESMLTVPGMMAQNKDIMAQYTSNMAQYTGNMAQPQFLTVKNIFDFLTKNWFPRSRQVDLYTQCPGVHRQPRGSTH